MDIKRVLVVVNSLDNIDKNLDKAFSIASKLNANIELLYVHQEPIFDISELFKDKKFDSSAVKETLKKELLKHTDKDIAIFVKISDTASAVWDLLRDDKSSLVVTPFSKTVLDIADKNSSSIYVIKHYDTTNKVALYTQSLEEIEKALNFIKEFGSNISLIYNFYYITYSDPLDPALGAFSVDNEVLLKSQEELFNNIKDRYSLDAKMFVNGICDQESIVDYINVNNYNLIGVYNIEESFILDSFKEILYEADGDIINL